MTIKWRDLLLSGGALLCGAAAGGLLPSGSARAHEYEIGKLIVEHPWVRAPLDGDSKAYFYAFIHNTGEAGDRLIGVKAEKFGKVEFHADAREEGPSEGHRDHTKANHHPRAGWRLCAVARHQEAPRGRLGP